MAESNQLARGRSVILQAIARAAKADSDSARAATGYLLHLEYENARLAKELANVRNVLRNDIVSACIEGCHVALCNQGQMRDGRGPLNEAGMETASEDGRALADQWVEMREAE